MTDLLTELLKLLPRQLLFISFFALVFLWFFNFIKATYIEKLLESDSLKFFRRILIELFVFIVINITFSLIFKIKYYESRPLIFQILNSIYFLLFLYILLLSEESPKNKMLRKIYKKIFSPVSKNRKIVHSLICIHTILTGIYYSFILQTTGYIINT